MAALCRMSDSSRDPGGAGHFGLSIQPWAGSACEGSHSIGPAGSLIGRWDRLHTEFGSPHAGRARLSPARRGTRPTTMRRAENRRALPIRGVAHLRAQAVSDGGTAALGDGGLSDIFARQHRAADDACVVAEFGGDNLDPFGCAKHRIVFSGLHNDG
jgi:hypothetical protein